MTTGRSANPADAVPLILGTRGSELALAQTALALEALRRAWPDGRFQIAEVRTTGDRRQDLSLTHLAPGGHGYESTDAGQPPGRVDPGLFTKELEAELLAGAISVAVHSLKDLPTAMPAGLKLAAVLPRGFTEDVLIYKPTAGIIYPALPGDAIVATSSLRRQRQLQWYWPGLQVCEVRGNVGTRLRKLHEHAEWTALVLARAGLVRLGFGAQLDAGYLETEGGRFAAQIFGTDTMFPAVGQGAIGLQARVGDAETLNALAAVNDAATWAAVTAERELLRLLGGGCQMPLGVTTSVDEERWSMRLRAVLFRADVEAPKVTEAWGPAREPETVAREVARKLALQG